MTKEIVKTEQDARAILESRGANHIQPSSARCGCGEASALLGLIIQTDFYEKNYCVNTEEIVGRIAICEECGDEWITK